VNRQDALHTGTRTRRKIRVVTLTDSLGSGGAERLAVQTTAGLDPDLFERTLCVTRQPGANDSPEYIGVAMEQLRAASVRVLQLPRSSRANLSAWWPLVQILRREHIEVLHSHKFGANVSGALLGRLCNVPVVIAHEHTWSFEGMPLRRLLDRGLVARASNVLIAVSREDRRRMIETERIDPARIVIIPNGISDLPPCTGHDVREELGIAKDATVIGTVSVLRPQKAIDVLISATAQLRDEFPDLHVLIVGDGDREPYEKLVDQLGLRGMVHLLGIRTDVRDLLAAFQVSICSSDFEGSPLAVIEYMAAGLPTVATRVGGVPDLIDDGVEGILVEPREPAALAAAVAALLRDPVRAANMGRRARERQQRDFTLRATVTRLQDLYERELALANGRNGLALTRRLPTA
jgi:glycosyltransferase involved in cell wall biosynthesis